MKKRKQLWNKVVSILMVFLMIATGFIQPVSATENNLAVESSEPTGAAENNAIAEGSEPAGAAENNAIAEGSEPAGAAENNAIAEGSEPAGAAESNTTIEGSEPASATESNTTVEGSEPASVTESNTTVEGSEPTGVTENNLIVESSEPISATETGQNALGELTKGGVPLQGIAFSIHTLSGHQWYDAVTDQDGKFGFVLPDGEYQLDGIWVETESKWYQLDKIVTVTEGSLTDINGLKIDLPTSEDPTDSVDGNVKGNVTKKGAVLPNLSFSIHTIDGSDVWYDTTTNANGAFGFELPDGEYKLDGIWFDGDSKWYQLDQLFTVVNGTLEGSTELTIELEAKEEDNVIGSVLKSEQPVENTLFSVHTTDGNDVWYDATTDAKGAFAFKLPDGEYKLDGVWVAEESQWYQLDKVFRVVNGTLEGSAELTIELGKVEAGKVIGSVLKSGQPVENTLFSVHTTDGNDVWYDATTDANGAFIFELPDGEYKLDGIWVAQNATWYQLDEVFTVVNGTLEGSTELTIELEEDIPPLEGNVTGSVLLNGQPINQVVSFSIQTTDGSDSWYDITTDSEGNFIVELPNGEYQLYGVWVEVGSQWHELHQVFTVNESAEVDIEIGTPPAGIEGSIVKDGQSINQVISFSVHTTDGSDVWYDAQTDEKGHFFIDLPDGEYKLDGIWMDEESQWYQLDQVFTVQDGALVGATELQIDLIIVPPPPPPTGSIVKDGQPVENLQFSVHTTDGSDVWYDAITDENGHFYFGLPDGEYKIDGVWVPSESEWYPLGLTFSVVNGVLVDQSTLFIDLAVPPVGNVQGTVEDENGTLSYAHLNIENLETREVSYLTTDENGAFNVQLSDGNYKIELFWINGISYAVYSDKEFSVVNGKLQVAGAELESLDVKLQPVSLNLQIVKDALMVKNAEVQIKQNNGGNVRYFYQDIDENGTASLRLLDGKYEVLGYYDYSTEEYYAINKSITITGGTTNPNPVVIDLSQNELTTIQGTLSDSDGFIGNSTLLVVNETAGGSSWADVGSDGSFSINMLPDGDYSIDYVYSKDFSYVHDVKINSMFDRFSIMDGKLLVNGTVVDSLDVTIPLETLKVQILDNAVPLQGEVVVYDSNDNSWYISTDENGEFALRVPVGEYTIESFSNDDVYYPINQIVYAESNAVEIQVIDVADVHEGGNVSGTVLDGAASVANSLLNIQNVNDYWDSYSVQTDEKGQFSADLPNGDYVISQVTDDQWNTIASIDLFFSVVNGDMVLNSEVVDELTVKLPTESLHVQVLNNGTPLVGGELNIYKYVNGYELSYITNTDENGEFVLRVPDGVYTIANIYEMTEPYDWYTIGTDVQVLNGTTTPNPFVIDVGGNKGNIQGVVQDENGPIGNANFSIADENGHWEQVSTDANGAFEVALEDGTYRIEEVYEGNAYIPMDIEFTVEDGLLYVNGTEAEKLVITVPPVVLEGTVMNEEGNTLPYTQLIIQGVNGSDYNYHKSVYADANGHFSSRLKDGNYRISGASIPNESGRTLLNLPFEIMDGALVVNGVHQDQLDVQIPAINVLGNIIDESGLAFGNSYLDIFNYDTKQSFIVRADESGEFSLRLQEGNYHIHNINTSQPKYESIPMQLDFAFYDGVLTVNGEVQETLTLQTPSANFIGQLVQSGEILTDSYINIMYQSVSDYYYGLSVATDEYGYFSGRLGDGIYTIDGVRLSNNQYIDLDIEFEVVNGIPSIDVSTLNIDIVHGNIQGVVQDETGPISNSKLRIEDANRDWMYVPVNSNGEFGVSLEDGTYKVTEVNLENGESIEINREFTVENGSLYLNGTLADQLTITIPSVTLKGKVVDESGVALSNGRIEIINDEMRIHYYSRIDENGAFSLRLPDGDYLVSEISIYQPNHEGHQIGASFSLHEGVLTVNGETQDTLDLQLSSVNFTGQLLNLGEVLSDSDIRIEYELLPNHYRGFYVTTDEDGYFTARLGDGSYTINRVDTANGDIKVNIEFEVINGIPSMDFSTLDVGVVEGNIQGVIQDENGPISNVWFNIEDENWNRENVAVNSNGEFGIELEDGTYRVTEVYSGEGNSVYLNSEFTVENGKLYVKGTETDRLRITIPPVATEGTVIDEAGGTYPYTNLTIESYNGSHYDFYSNIQTDVDGSFSARLSDGSYRISRANIYGEHRSTALLNISFDIVDGKLVIDGVNTDRMEVKLPPITIQGTVVDENGTAPKNGHIEFSRIDTASFYSFNVNEQGEFSLRLPDGEYKVTGINSYDGSHKFVPTQLVFLLHDGILTVDGKIQETLTLQIPQVNVTGQLLQSGEILGDSSLKLLYEMAPGQLRGFSIYTDENGYFSGSLGDGSYRITTVETVGERINIKDIEFEVSNGVPSIDFSQFDIGAM